MPVTRLKKSTVTAGSKIPKPAKVSSENQVRAARCGPLAPPYQSQLTHITGVYHPGKCDHAARSVFLCSAG